MDRSARAMQRDGSSRRRNSLSLEKEAETAFLSTVSKLKASGAAQSLVPPPPPSGKELTDREIIIANAKIKTAGFANSKASAPHQLMNGPREMHDMSAEVDEDLVVMQRRKGGRRNLSVMGGLTHLVEKAASRDSVDGGYQAPDIRDDDADTRLPPPKQEPMVDTKPATVQSIYKQKKENSTGGKLLDRNIKKHREAQSIQVQRRFESGREEVIGGEPSQRKPARKKVIEEPSQATLAQALVDEEPGSSTACYREPGSSTACTHYSLPTLTTHHSLRSAIAIPYCVRRRMLDSHPIGEVSTKSPS